MQISPEIRFRIDRSEREQFEQIARRVGMDPNEMVKVFIRRAIAAGGFPFEMRVPDNDPAPAGQLLPVADQLAPVHGVPVSYLAQVAQRAAQAAYEEHAKAGRLLASPPRDKQGTSR